jgi:hypothetical protein
MGRLLVLVLLAAAAGSAGAQPIDLNGFCRKLF